MLLLLLALVIVMITSCFEFSDKESSKNLNDHRGHVVMDTIPHTDGMVKRYDYVVRDPETGDYDKFTISEDFHLFEIGDTL